MVASVGLQRVADVPEVELSVDDVAFAAGHPQTINGLEARPALRSQVWRAAR